MDARERVEGFGPKPPKEQPPRNLSGKEDRADRTLWKAGRASGSTEGATSLGGGKLSGLRTEGVLNGFDPVRIEPRY